MTEAAPGTIPTVILCGGRGTRMRGSAHEVPKPMMPIGGRPILWHIMKIYATHGHTEFVLALGHGAAVFKEWFLHYEPLTCDFTIELGRRDAIRYLSVAPETGWRVSCIDTGLDAHTATRVRRATAHLPAGPVMVTYGDGVSDVDITSLVAFHRSHGRLATVTAVRPPSRYGELDVDDTARVASFREKPAAGSGFVNGGFMVFEREAIDAYMPADDDVMLEDGPLARLADDGELIAFEHEGFWQSMDSPWEHDLLARLWDSGKAPWKVW